MCDRIAVVTGANKGLGFALVRGLCKRYNGTVYLTSRNVERGKNAVKLLNKEGLFPEYHQLDITDVCSVIRLRNHIIDRHGGFDILINNVGIYLNDIDKVPVLKDVEETLDVNYFSLVSVCKILLPILSNGGRVVNVSSKISFPSHIKSEELQEKFKDPNLTIDQLSGMMMDYIDAVKRGQYHDWHNSAYVVSKVGVTALTKILQRMVDCRGRYKYIRCHW